MTAPDVTFRRVGEGKPGQYDEVDVLAHEVTGGAGAATVSVISALVMAVVLCLLVTLIFIRKALQEERELDAGAQPSGRNGSGA